jgi:hypothetical protein
MKARIENGTIKLYGELPQDFENILYFRNADETTVKSKGFYDVVDPVWNPETQVLGEIYFDAVNEVFTYPVTDKTPEQIEAETIQRINAEADMLFNRLDPQLVKKLLSDRLAALPEEEAVEYRSMYKPFKIGIVLETNEKIYNPSNDTLYKVLVGHTTALEWLPENTPTLFVVIHPPGVIPDWVQPTGAHDAYQIGNKVKHNGSTWESTVNANTWEPGVYGWNLID